MTITNTFLILRPVVVYASHRYVDAGIPTTATNSKRRVGWGRGRGREPYGPSLIVAVVITLFISLAVYGASGNFNLSG